MLSRRGGGEDRPTRPQGKIVINRGLWRTLDRLATEAILDEESRAHGGPPPRVATMLSRPPTET